MRIEVGKNVYYDMTPVSSGKSRRFYRMTEIDERRNHYMVLSVTDIQGFSRDFRPFRETRYFSKKANSAFWLRQMMRFSAVLSCYLAREVEHEV